jgi:hypothetical protein
VLVKRALGRIGAARIGKRPMPSLGEIHLDLEPALQFTAPRCACGRG